VALGCTAGLIALIGRRLLDPSVGFTAGLLFAGIPMVSRYSQEARPYAFAIAGATLATLLLLRATEAPSWRRWGWYGGCLIFAGLMHIVTLTVLVAHAVLIWRVFRTAHDFRLLRWIAAVAVAIGCALPLVTKGSRQTGAIAWIKADGSAVRQMPEKIFGSPAVALTIIVLALIAVAALWKTDRRAMGLLVPWAVFPPLFCYLTFPLLHLFLHRYLLFTVPAWTLLAAALGYAVARHVRDRQPSLPLSLGALLIVAVVFFVGEPGQVAARRDPVLGEPDFHGAALVVQEQAQKGDGIVYAGITRNARRAFAYEEKLGVLDTPRDVLLGRSAQDAGTFGAEECADPIGCVGDTRRIWLVSATEPSADPLSGLSYDAKALLGVDFDSTEIEQLEHVRIFLLQREATP
jgi:mannosyltransferase